MPSHVALLRAVNVARTQVAMADLRAMFVQAGLGDARTLLQSGNVVFSSRKSPTALEALLEVEAKKQLGLTTDFFVRTAAEWKKLIAANPFTAEAKADPAHLVVMFLKEAPSAAAVKALAAAIPGREQVRAQGDEAYLVYPDGIGRSRVTNALIEKHLQTRGTGRNWNTVLKLAALLGE